MFWISSGRGTLPLALDLSSVLENYKGMWDPYLKVWPNQMAWRPFLVTHGLFCKPTRIDGCTNRHKQCTNSHQNWFSNGLHTGITREITTELSTVWSGHQFVTFLRIFPLPQWSLGCSQAISSTHPLSQFTCFRTSYAWTHTVFALRALVLSLSRRFLRLIPIAGSVVHFLLLLNNILLYEYITRTLW